MENSGSTRRYVQGGHPGAVPKGSPFVPSAVETGRGQSHTATATTCMSWLVHDDGVVVLRGWCAPRPGSRSTAPSAQQGNVSGWLSARGVMMKWALRNRVASAWSDAGYLLARHGVAANKAHPPLGRHWAALHDCGLDTAYVAHQAAGFEAFGVVLEKVHDALGVLAQDDHVRPPAALPDRPWSPGGRRGVLPPCQVAWERTAPTTS